MGISDWTRLFSDADPNLLTEKDVRDRITLTEREANYLKTVLAMYEALDKAHTYAQQAGITIEITMTMKDPTA